MKLRVPKYFNDFKCIADKCEDTCCAGWGIVIDEETNKKYQSVKGAFGERLRSEIVNEGGENVFTLKGNNCPFLDSNKMCDIYKELGEDSLCYTCQQYPRFTEEFGGLREVGISLSCPEAARIILNKDIKTTFEICEINEEITRYNDINAQLYLELMQCRNIIFKILQNRDSCINERCIKALMFVEEIQQKIDELKIKDIKEVREKFSNDNINKELNDYIEKYKNRKEERYETINEYIKIFRDLKHISPNDPLGLEDVLRYFWQSEDDINLYFAKNQSFEEATKSYEYKYENILIYYIFRYFMKSVFDYDAIAKMKFSILSYIIIRELALVRFIENGELQNSDMVDIAHMYSKDIEHLEENVEALYEFFETEECFSNNKIIFCLLN